MGKRFCAFWSAQGGRLPRITPVKWRVLACIFEKAGFRFDRQNGDHRVYVKDGVLRPVIIPTYNEICQDLIKSNMRTAHMDREIYFQFLKECK